MKKDKHFFVEDDILAKGFCSKDKLKVLNPKEQKLKQDIFNYILESKAKDSEVIRVLAKVITDFKKIKKR